jgi:hypothetical protein
MPWCSTPGLDPRLLGLGAGGGSHRGAVGVVIEMVILKRIYNAPELFQLVATFGIVLIMAGRHPVDVGGEDRFGPRAPGLDGVVRIFGEPIPQYDLLLIALGPIVLGADVAAAQPHPLGHSGARRHAGPRDGGALGVNQSVAVHHGVLPRLLPRRASAARCRCRVSRSTC